MLQNEVLLRQVLRTYRNALVEFVRVKLERAFGTSAIDEVAKLFAKKDENGVTRWDALKKNAIRARVAPEVDTVVADDFELLGVADFYPIFEKFHEQLFPEWAAADDDLRREHKAGILRCMRQIKVMRDPTSHEVTQDVGRDEFILTASNALIVLKQCGCDHDADDVRATIVTAATEKPRYSVALLTDQGVSEHTAGTISRRLSADGINVASFAASYSEADLDEADPTLPSHANIVPIIETVPHENSPAARLLKSAAGARNIVPVLTAECDPADWPTFANSIGTTSTARVILHPEYVSEGIDRLIDRLQAELAPRARREFSATVPVARSVSDERLRARLADQLRQRELRAVWLVSPFASNVDNWTVHVRSLSTILAQLQQREVPVTLITRPPSKSEGYERKKDFLSVLARNGVRVLLHEYLHAKIYLFEGSGSRFRWFVGSHNLTASGLHRLKEVSMEGYREAEYREAENAMIKIRDHRATQPFDIWIAREALQAGSRH